MVISLEIVAGEACSSRLFATCFSICSRVMPFATAGRTRPSVFACPDCHGVLWEIEDGELLRFRCRIGHAYTADSLRLALTQSGEDALWIALRTIEEKAELFRRMSGRSRGRLAELYKQEAASFDHHADTIRQILAGSQGVRKGEDEVTA